VALQLLAPGGRAALVGDPRQLPATLLSRAAEAANLAQSLFERLQRVRRRVPDGPRRVARRAPPPPAIGYRVCGVRDG